MSTDSALARLALSRERLRQALAEDTAAAMPESRRPLGNIIGAAHQIGRVALRPLAQRHPLGLMVGALLAGGLLAWGRPWRWPLKPALLAAWWPQLLMAALAQATAQPGLSASASPRTAMQAPAARA
jgi:hypothetical protein